MNRTEQITALISFVFFMLLVFFFAITLAVRYRKRKREHDELKERFERERLKIQVEIQEETLQHISRELHDNLGHTASLIKINLNTIFTDDRVAAEKIEDTKELARQLIGDLKQLSVSMNSSRIIHKGLLPAIHTEVERLNKTGVIKATLTMQGDMPAIESDKAVVVFRMVQEAINNILKHSKATDMAIVIHCIKNIVDLELRDNGTGFDANKLPGNEGTGLYNLRNRAALINASVNIKSAVGEGTVVSIRLE